MKYAFPGPHYDVDVHTMDVAVEVVSMAAVAESLVAVVLCDICVNRSGIRGSAVCAFTLSAIDKSFEGAFKEQKTPHSNWLPVADKDVPQPHPALVEYSTLHFYYDDVYSPMKVDKTVMMMMMTIVIINTLKYIISLFLSTV